MHAEENLQVKTVAQALKKVVWTSHREEMATHAAAFGNLTTQYENFPAVVRLINFLFVRQPRVLHYKSTKFFS